eukprot:146070-Chlamydomonas_euryale.AAC.1
MEPSASSSSSSSLTLPPPLPPLLLDLLLAGRGGTSRPVGGCRMRDSTRSIGSASAVARLCGGGAALLEARLRVRPTLTVDCEAECWVEEQSVGWRSGSRRMGGC